MKWRPFWTWAQLQPVHGSFSVDTLLVVWASPQTNTSTESFQTFSLSEQIKSTTFTLTVKVSRMIWRRQLSSDLSEENSHSTHTFLMLCVYKTPVCESTDTLTSVIYRNASQSFPSTTQKSHWMSNTYILSCLTCFFFLHFSFMCNSWITKTPRSHITVVSTGETNMFPLLSFTCSGANECSTHRTPEGLMV